jgi:hypothetical protein
VWFVPSFTLDVQQTVCRVTMLTAALEIGCTALQTFTATFGVPFALPKLDLASTVNRLACDLFLLCHLS